MSGGGGETARESYRDNGTPSTQRATNKRPGKDEFAKAIARIAVAQVCEVVGFQSFQQSALDTLCDVAVRYILETGKTANLYSNLAGRTQGSVFDFIQSLEDLGSCPGFADASDVNRCLAESGMVREIAQYVNDAEEIPFAYSIPQFPAFGEQKPSPTFVRSGETPSFEYIPTWLPPFPDPKTYSPSHVQNQSEPGANMDKIEQVKDAKKMEQSILNLQPRVASNGFEVPSTVDPDKIAKDKGVAYCNPFLALPLQLREKEISAIVCPASLSDEVPVRNHTSLENHVSVLVTFAPATEAVKIGLGDSKEREEIVLLDSRPALRLKFGMLKKFLGTAHSLQSKGFEKTTTWFGENNESDEKKRRAEQILKISMEDTHDLTML